nr:hypothetical protein [uncultured Prevotella sp.]
MDRKEVELLLDDVHVTMNMKDYPELQVSVGNHQIPLSDELEKHIRKEVLDYLLNKVSQVKTERVKPESAFGYVDFDKVE